MGQSELEQRIETGIRRITEAKAEGREVADWERHLKKLQREFREKLLQKTFDEIKEFYVPRLYQWIEDNEQGLNKELQEIEDELSVSIVSENEVEIYKQSLESFKKWHHKAIAAYKAKSNNKGGETEMALIAKAPKRELCPEGVHNAVLADTEPRHHEEWGERVLLTFDLCGKTHDDGTDMKVFEECSLILTPKAKLRKIVEALLNRKLSKDEAEGGVDVESLIGLNCQLVLAHKEGKNGNIYPRVDTVLPAK